MARPKVTREERAQMLNGKVGYIGSNELKRTLGRRAYRAQKRANRILARQENGTYTQPSGGKPSNSP